MPFLLKKRIEAIHGERDVFSIEWSPLALIGSTE